MVVELDISLKCESMAAMIESYWLKKDYKRFTEELKKFIGFITRQYFPGFRQSTELYDNLREDIIAETYAFLLGGHYEKTKLRLAEQGKPLKYASYLFTQIRGELTKFFNKYNKRRKRETNIDCFNFHYAFSYDWLRMILSDIIHTKYMNLDDDEEDIYNFFKHEMEPPNGFKNMFQLKILAWSLLSKEGMV